MYYIRSVDPDQVAFVAAAMGASFASGVLSTVSGLGGGVAIIALLAIFVPAHQVVVFSAPVLLIGNASRFYLFRRHVDRPLLGWFLVGGIPAAIVGSALLPHIPVRTLEIALATFMLIFVAESLLTRNWRDEPRERPVRRGMAWLVRPATSFAVVGAGAGFLSSTVGASGPFTAPFLATKGLSKQRFVGTISGGTTALNVAKISTFASVGLLGAENIPALVGAGIAIVAGNLVGRRMLDRTSHRTFAILLIIVIAVSAVQLLIG
jgi:uncharacterized membrane protein YfcA